MFHSIKMKCYFFGVLFLLHNVVAKSRIDPIVITNLGLIRGLEATDGEYSMFLGIPYAKVDNKNPFGVSTPYPAFNETFEAIDDSAFCPQVHPFNGSIGGTIDCLRINIYVPSSATTKNKLPVMVWIHGGAFHYGLGGRSMYGPKYFVKHDVIVVTVNYRLNVYGFMCLDIPEVPGNQGLKDQYLAFEWINKHISSFGGDADKIILFGESAGGHSIDFHLMSTKNKIYQKVIMQSGSAMSATVLYEPDRLAPVKLAQHLGCECNNTHEALTFIANAESDLVVAAFIDLDMQFKPCAEIEFDGVESFITHLWMNTNVPKVKDMPVLLGFNQHERALRQLNKDAKYYQNLDLVTDHLKQLFIYKDDAMFSEMKDIILHYYFGDKNISEAVQWDIMEYDSDSTYIYPVHRTMRNYLNSGVGNVFLYMFSYIGGMNNIVTENSNNLCCASHDDELSYMWERNYKPQPTELDMDIIDKITTMWTNFAKYSDPTPEVSKLLPVKWISVTNDTYNYLNINSNLSVEQRPLNRRMAFWELFYKKYGNYYKYYEKSVARSTI